MTRVQAILMESTPMNGIIETITDSILVEDDNAEKAMDTVMRKHKSSYHYLYIMQNAETQQEVYRTTENKYQW